MKTHYKLFLLLTISFSTGEISGQTVKHIIEGMEKGEILVFRDTDGENVRYQALMFADVRLESCFNVMKQTETHKKIISGASTTEMVKKISDDEWYNYYFFRGGMGMPGFDAVMKMKYFLNDDQKSFALHGSASPSQIESKRVERIKTYEIRCFVREIESEKVEISIFAEFKPIYPAAAMKIEMWYPEPASLLEGIVWLAEGL